MRKILLSIAIMLASMTCFSANEEKIEILLQVNYSNNGTGSGKPHRIPAPTPEVCIEGHTLYFSSTYGELGVKIVDEDLGMTYELGTIVEDNMSIVIPASLSGTYSLILTRGDIYYTGIIEL